MAGFFERVAEGSFAPRSPLRPAAALPYARRADPFVEDGELTVATPDLERPESLLSPPLAADVAPPKRNAVSTQVERHRDLAVGPVVPDGRELSQQSAAARAPSTRGGRESKQRATAHETLRTATRVESVEAAPREPGARPSNSMRADARLIPTVSARPPQPKGAAGSRPSTQVARDLGPPPDVNIHIGRIELTAVTSPAPSRREPARSKKPMSLDEYLQRRSEKRR